MLLRTDCVVPFTMKRIASDPDGRHLLVSDPDLGRILFRVQNAPDFETATRLRTGNQVHNNCACQQRLPPPVLSDIREQTMFDLVPFAGAGRQMTDRYLQTGLVGQFLHEVVPVMRRKGLTDAEIESILTRNPARVLTIA